MGILGPRVAHNRLVVGYVDVSGGGMSAILMTEPCNRNRVRVREAIRHAESVGMLREVHAQGLELLDSR